MSFIDTLLYRPLASGKEYEGLIPKYNGTQYKFDKDSDNSTTYDTLRYMSEWAYKYANQMIKVAPRLKGNTTAETVNKIYKFLYYHFQYKLDGELQNLMSPSAAWHYRKSGFDCKTYSILASTILQNLGIPHSFRMVQQAGIMPGEWSHVYVIVPNGNSHLVIDGTTHDNKEVSYTNKHDFTMKHNGLASPYISALGCACQGTPIRSNGLGSPATLANTIKNFHSFLNELEKKGISRDVTNKMLSIVQYNVSKGIDPNMGQIIEKALAGQNGLGLTSAGFSFPTMNVSTPTGNYVAPQTQSQFSQAFSGVKQQGVSALSNVSVKGINVGGIATSLATGNFVGAGLEVLKAIIPIEKTFGAVFANGFDLSCWGASYSEQKAKEDILLDIPFMVEWSGIYQSATSQNLDKFMMFTEGYLMDSKNGQQSKYAKCTRKGHALRQNAVEQLRKDTFEQFTSQGFQLMPIGQKIGNIAIGLPGYAKGRTFTLPEIRYDSYSVIPPVQVSQSQNTTTDANGNIINAPVSTKSASISPIAIGGALLLGLKLLL